ncbi:MAG: hypothetical protein ACRDPK_16290, partial [Carbonactinosporaceae bacterium]
AVTGDPLAPIRAPINTVMATVGGGDDPSEPTPTPDEVSRDLAGVETAIAQGDTARAWRLLDAVRDKVEQLQGPAARVLEQRLGILEQRLLQSMETPQPSVSPTPSVTPDSTTEPSSTPTPTTPEESASTPTESPSPSYSRSERGGTEQGGQADDGARSDQPTDAPSASYQSSADPEESGSSESPTGPLDLTR